MNRTAIKKYKQFHGRRPYCKLTKNIKDFNTLVYLAQPEFLTYISDKINGGGTGRKEYFKHKFSKSTKLYCTPDGKMLIIMGSNMKVTPRGIVG